MALTWVRLWVFRYVAQASRTWCSTSSRSFIVALGFLASRKTRTEGPSRPSILTTRSTRRLESSDDGGSSAATRNCFPSKIYLESNWCQKLLDAHSEVGLLWASFQRASKYSSDIRDIGANGDECKIWRVAQLARKIKATFTHVWEKMRLFIWFHFSGPTQKKASKVICCSGRANEQWRDNEYTGSRKELIA